MKKAKFIYFLSVFVLVWIFPVTLGQTENIHEALARGAVTSKDLLEKREAFFKRDNSSGRRNNLINILIVPGHDDKYSGTQNLGLREVDLNRALSQKLYDLLLKEEGINVVLSSDHSGYNRIFEKYFDREQKNIQKFIRESKRDFERRIRKEEINFSEKNFHNKAPDEVAERLYGINRWVNERKFDFVIHVHFNDYAGRYSHSIPKYEGFTIYIPENQFDNHEVSKAIADKIFGRMKDFTAVSNLPMESAGVVEDQELIAIGSNGTLEAGSMLIEYGYIYENKFMDLNVRNAVLQKMAEQTYKGIKDFFGESYKIEDKYVHRLSLSKSKYVERSIASLMLQNDLSELGYYPPTGKSLSECPITGYFGDCTVDAVINFQKDNGLQAEGYFGPLTQEVLNNLMGRKKDPTIAGSL